MKNIFLIPTDKESRLWRDLDSNKLTFSNLSQPNSNECTKCSNEYVYITSDEKLKDGEYGLSKLNEVIKFHSGYDSRYYMKIVMTNDLELIEDGVQEIGERFFEWFVLNQTCEEVEIGKTNKLLNVYEDEWETKYHIYNIHEEPKKNFYCGDEADYGEQCGFQCENCVDKNGVDYGYLPKEDLGYTTKIGIKVVDGMVRPLMVPKKYFGEVEEIKKEWSPSQGEVVWIKVFSNWSFGTYIGYDVVKKVHFVREDEQGGGHLYSSDKVLPYDSMPNEPNPTIEDLKINQYVYHKDIYWGREQMKIVGLRENEVELEGDYSGGTHNSVGKQWFPIEGLSLTKMYIKN